MSEMELHTGTATEVAKYHETFEDKLSHIKKKFGVEFEETSEPLDNYKWVSGNEFFYDNNTGTMYKLEDTEHDSYGSCTAFLSSEGVYTYMLHWYNGGGGFSEVLEAAIKEASG